MAESKCAVCKYPFGVGDVIHDAKDLSAHSKRALMVLIAQIIGDFRMGSICSKCLGLINAYDQLETRLDMAKSRLVERLDCFMKREDNDVMAAFEDLDTLDNDLIPAADLEGFDFARTVVKAEIFEEDLSASTSAIGNGTPTRSSARIKGERPMVCLRRNLAAASTPPSAKRNGLMFHSEAVLANPELFIKPRFGEENFDYILNVCPEDVREDIRTALGHLQNQMPYQITDAKTAETWTMGILRMEFPRLSFGVPGEIICFQCDVTYPDVGQKLCHELKSHCSDQRPFECELCGRSVGEEYNIVSHLRKHHTIDVEQESPSAKVLPLQIQAGDGQKIKCPICPILFASELAFEFHVYLRHKRYVNRPCCFCTKPMHNSAMYRQHVLTEHGQAHFQCYACSFNDVTLSAFQDHVLTHHADEAGEESVQALKKLGRRVMAQPKAKRKNEEEDELDKLIKEEPSEDEEDEEFDGEEPEPKKKKRGGKKGKSSDNNRSPCPESVSLPNATGCKEFARSGRAFRNKNFQKCPLFLRRDPLGPFNEIEVVAANPEKFLWVNHDTYSAIMQEFPAHIIEDVNFCYQYLKDHMPVEINDHQTSQAWDIALMRMDSTKLSFGLTGETCCFLCNVYFYHVPEKMLHMVSKHGSNNDDDCSYSCAYCAKTFADHKHASNHVNKHHRSKVAKFKDESGRRDPINMPDGLLQCRVCSLVCQSLYTYWYHMFTSHKKYSAIKCMKCQQPFNTATKYRWHVLIEHCGARFHCYTCKYTSENEDNFKHHVFNSHNNRKRPFQDEKDSPAASTKRWKGPVERFTCEICSEVSRGLIFHAKHLLVFHGISKKMECDQCGVQCENVEELQKHEKTHFSISCHVCGKMFKYPYSLENHLKKEHKKGVVDKPAGPQSNFLCEFCSKTFEKKEYLAAHMYSHMEKKFGCKFCDKVFRWPSSLRSHMVNSHQETDVNLKQCRYCGKTFRDPSNLKAHEYTHTNEKPHVCGKCGRGFIRKDMKLTHEKSCIAAAAIS